MSSDDRLWDDTMGHDDLESAMAWQPKPPVQEEEEEPWQPIDYFFDEAKLSPGDSRHTGVSLPAVLPVGPPQHGYIGVCRYEQGRHIIGTKHCPHTQEFDDAGRVMPQGWTVQK